MVTLLPATQDSRDISASPALCKTELCARPTAGLHWALQLPRLGRAITCPLAHQHRILPYLQPLQRFLFTSGSTAKVSIFFKAPPNVAYSPSILSPLPLTFLCLVPQFAIGKMYTKYSKVYSATQSSIIQASLYYASITFLMPNTSL